jgi:hypothetical protein
MLCVFKQTVSRPKPMVSSRPYREHLGYWSVNNQIASRFFCILSCNITEHLLFWNTVPPHLHLLMQDIYNASPHLATKHTLIPLQHWWSWSCPITATYFHVPCWHSHELFFLESQHYTILTRWIPHALRQEFRKWHLVKDKWFKSCLVGFLFFPLKQL